MSRKLDISCDPNMLRRAKQHQRLDDDLRYYCHKVLKIKPKTGPLEAFVLNDAQTYLHNEIEKQRSDLGRVRVLILKGRQQGCSTYVGSRYYHKAVRLKNRNVFILSHESETTKKLFSMVERFQENTPEFIRPEATTANKSEYKFAQIGSEYAVGTARNEDVGRGGTVQLFHGSEVAFWEKTDGIETGILQSIADMDDTEIILESTANGMNGMFYRMCMTALEEKGDYRLVFIPWFWQDEYSRVIPSDKEMQLDEEELEYQENYGLTDQQIYWRRSKIITLGKGDYEDGLWKFKQEYPANVMEAFQTSGKSLIRPAAVTRARQSKMQLDMMAPLVIGVDGARNGDRTVISFRRGRHFMEPEIMTFDGDEDVQMQIAGKIAKYIDDLDPAKVFIDVAHGYGVRDRLVERGYGNIIEGIHFGSQAIESELYINKRSEMWCLMQDWFHGEEGQVSIPDSDLIQRDLSAMPEATTTSNGRKKFPLKVDIKKNAGFSPDIGDSMALTFAFPILRKDHLSNTGNRIRKKNGEGGPLKTLRKRRQSGSISSTSSTSGSRFWSK